MINAQDFKKYVDNKFHNFNASKTLAHAWNAGEFVFLYGPGGYGKSDVALMLFEYLKAEGEISDEKPFVFNFDQTTDKDVILGGTNIKEFTENSKLIYNVEDSFLNYEFVVFEEMGDAYSLSALKDILQSRQLRNGKQVFDMRTKIIVACTNKEYDDLVSDASTAALMQRFMYYKRVAWDSHSRGDYQAMLSKRGFEKKVSEFISEVIFGSNNTNSLFEEISPRMADKIAKAFEANQKDPESIIDMLGITESAVEQAVNKFGNLKEDDFRKERFLEIGEVAERIDNIEIDIQDLIRSEDLDLLDDPVLKFAFFTGKYLTLREKFIAEFGLTLEEQFLEKGYSDAVNNNVRRVFQNLIPLVESETPFINQEYTDLLLNQKIGDFIKKAYDEEK